MAISPAQIGAAALEPMAKPVVCVPVVGLVDTSAILLATAATSGRLRLVVEPPFLLMSMPD